MARRAAEQDHDPSRREFFKTFSRDALQNAGAVAGAAAEIRRTSMAAARELLDIDDASRTPMPPTARQVVTPESSDAPADTFRSAYRYSGTALIVLDQRELPSRVVTFECSSANEVAGAIRSGAVTPGPVMGQVAAYGVALAASEAATKGDRSRDEYVRSAADAIRAGRAEVNAVRRAVTRMIERYDELMGAEADTTTTAEQLAAEADAIATEATAACAEIGRRWSELVVGDQLNVVVHGDSGPLACGMVGMSTSAILSMIAAGRRVHVWVADASPSGEGTRITALQLTQLDIPHTIIPDSAVGWLFSNRHIDAVALRGDTVASNGDTVALLGAKAIAQLASAANVAVHVLASEASWDRRAGDASHLALDLRSTAELGSTTRARLSPAFDIVPARVVSAYVGEGGVLTPPFKEPR